MHILSYGEQDAMRPKDVLCFERHVQLFLDLWLFNAFLTLLLVF